MLSVLSTIQEHQELANECLLILVSAGSPLKVPSEAEQHVKSHLWPEERGFLDCGQRADYFPSLVIIPVFIAGLGRSPVLCEA